jgi:hypothetical protein
MTAADNILRAEFHAEHCLQYDRRCGDLPGCVTYIGGNGCYSRNNSRAAVVTRLHHFRVGQVIVLLSGAFDARREEQCEKQATQCHAAEVPPGADAELVGVRRNADDRCPADPPGQPEAGNGKGSDLAAGNKVVFDAALLSIGIQANHNH